MCCCVLILGCALGPDRQHNPVSGRREAVAAVGEASVEFVGKKKKCQIPFSLLFFGPAGVFVFHYILTLPLANFLSLF